MTLHDRSSQVFVTKMFKVKGAFLQLQQVIFDDLTNVATNSEILVNPSRTVFFYNIKVMSNGSNRILKIWIDNTSFTNSLVQN